MFTYVCQNIIRALLFKFTQAIINSWLAFKFFFVFQNSICKINTINHFNLQGFFYTERYIIGSLSYFILEKADAKLLKQQLFNNFWQYLSIGESLWSLNCSTHFEFPIGTSNILNLFVSCVLSWIFLSLFLLVWPPRFQSLLIMGWCSSKTRA